MWIILFNWIKNWSFFGGNTRHLSTSQCVTVKQYFQWMWNWCSVCLFVFFKYTKGVSSKVFRRCVRSKRQLCQLFRPGQTKTSPIVLHGSCVAVLVIRSAICRRSAHSVSFETHWVLRSPLIPPHIRRIEQQHRLCYRRCSSEVTVRAWNLIFGPPADRGRRSRCSQADVTAEGIILLTSVLGFVLICVDQRWTNFSNGGPQWVLKSDGGGGAGDAAHKWNKKYLGICRKQWQLILSERSAAVFRSLFKWFVNAE